MANPYFQFKQFTVYQDRCAMKVTTDGCLFGAWCAEEIMHLKGFSKSLLDIGAGTGLLSLMVAQKNGLVIDAVEIEEEAASQAVENFNVSPWKENLHVIQGDVATLDLKNYDYIVSNPPFYENELQSPNTLRNTAHHSHQLKLYDLLQIIANNLADGGKFFLLLPYKRIQQARDQMQAHGLFPIKELFAHQSVNHPPFRYLVMGGKKGFENVMQQSIYIKDESNQYTQDFQDLLKDYYLYL